MGQYQFLEILEQHKGILHKIANNYSNNKEDQRDLIQEMSLQLYRSFDKYDSRFQWSTYIYRIALNVAISYYRKEKSSFRATGISESLLEMPDPESIVQSEHEHLGLLRKFIGQLNPLDKALMLLYLDETSTMEVANILGITETNVTSKIHRIKIKNTI
jgi:RNA polymerase sigma factor (sigma-70 family)